MFLSGLFFYLQRSGKCICFVTLFTEVWWMYLFCDFIYRGLVNVFVLWLYLQRSGECYSLCGLLYRDGRRYKFELGPYRIQVSLDYFCKPFHQICYILLMPVAADVFCKKKLYMYKPFVKLFSEYYWLR